MEGVIAEQYICVSLWLRYVNLSFNSGLYVRMVFECVLFLNLFSLLRRHSETDEISSSSRLPGINCYLWFPVGGTLSYF